MSKPGLILQHGHDGPPARFGDWLRDCGLAFEVHEAWREAPPDPTGYSFVASLGSEQSAADTGNWVPAEIEMLRRAVAADVPVLGLCFGGQALSIVLGGGIEKLERPEIGWVAVDSSDPAVGPGPWLQYHFEQLRVPPGGVELARSPAGVAAFRHGRHLGLQFHPEADAALVDLWARTDPKLPETGLTVAELAAQSEAHAGNALTQARALFDAWSAAALG